MGLGNFLYKRWLGCGYAWKGAVALVRREPSVQVQLFIGIAITVFGFIMDISRTDWMLQTFAIGLVMACEGLNSAIEGICDFVHPDRHPAIGHIKDIAAGAVVFAAITAVIIAGLIYVPLFI